MRRLREGNKEDSSNQALANAAGTAASGSPPPEEKTAEEKGAEGERFVATAELGRLPSDLFVVHEVVVGNGEVGCLGIRREYAEASLCLLCRYRHVL